MESKKEEGYEKESPEESMAGGFISTAEKPGSPMAMDIKKPYYPSIHLKGKAAGICKGMDIGDEGVLVVKYKITGKQEHGTDLEIVGVKKSTKESKRIL